jgi:hypothetical protein
MDIQTLSVLSLVDLKQLARDHRPRIPQYYTKKRKELIYLLSLPELPEPMRIQKLTITQLREEAKAKGMGGGIWKLSKEELLNLLYPCVETPNSSS